MYKNQLLTQPLLVMLKFSDLFCESIVGSVSSNHNIDREFLTSGVNYVVEGVG